MCEEVQLYSTLAESWQLKIKRKEKVKSKHLKAYSVVVSNWHNHPQPNNSWLLNKQLHLIVVMSSYILLCNEKCGGDGLNFQTSQEAGIIYKWCGKLKYFSASNSENKSKRIKTIQLVIILQEKKLNLKISVNSSLPFSKDFTYKSNEKKGKAICTNILQDLMIVTAVAITVFIFRLYFIKIAPFWNFM